MTTEDTNTCFADLPNPLEPAYHTADVNTPIELYNGPVDIISNEGTTHGKSGKVSLVWLPWPRIRISVDDFSPVNPFEDKMDWRISAPGRQRARHVSWTDVKMSGGDAAKSPTSTGILRDDDTFAGCRLSAILFHVSNGPEYNGAWVRNLKGKGAGARRAVLQAAPWRITLDAVREWTTDDAHRRLRASGGYAITHMGRLDREDGEPFDGQDADAHLEAFGWLLSFCRGAWTFPLLLVGKDADTHEHRELWRCPKIDAATRNQSWFNRLSTEGFGVLPGLVAKLGDAIWGEPVRNALHWYIVANKPGPVSIEGAIVLQQAAFELLAWTLLVEDRKVLSDDGIQKLWASDRIRRMLSACDIPLEIPTRLDDLLKVAKAENWQDGPRATTEIRNAIVHSSPKKRARILAHGPDARTDTWILGQWYLELVLLKLIGFTGRYSNRLSRGVCRGEEVEPVPWAK